MARKDKAARSLMEQIADLDDVAPKDFDPEDIDDGRGSDDEESSVASEDAAAGREHYQSVGKSKLRKPETVTLGREYDGSRVSRDALNGDDSDDDPFRKRSSDEEGSGMSDEESDEDEDMQDFEEGDSESEEELENGIEGRLRKSKLEDDDEDEDEDEEEEEDDDESDGFDDEESDISAKDDSKSESRDELRRLMASDQKTVAASISQAAKADAAKGQAVKRQRSTFDALLNSRIKLQKGLAALNDVPNVAEEGNAIDVDVVKSAESAALSLWSMLEDLRHTLADTHAKDSSKKRKREPAASSSTSSTLLWERTEKIESEVRPHRRAVLDKWSSKVRGSGAPPNAQGKLMNRSSNQQQSITTVLDAHLATETSQITAALSKSNGVNGSASTTTTTTAVQEIYDDTPFYQSLLRDLVEQRMSSDALTNGADTLQNLQLPANLSVHPTTGMRKDKKKKAVDTKASKGRKMRYTVHEKLQNFMAPEDRGSWGDRAREEFFASLLGRTVNGVLGEDEDEADGVVSEDDNEEGGLRLFRS
ncbi:rRNA-processing protein bfr2 [Arachnomyces sp. PD_36]|nr:rRNA-processing protein bfr2 [Arachnomyces sp. PD_36]